MTLNVPSLSEMAARDALDALTYGLRDYPRPPEAVKVPDIKLPGFPCFLSPEKYTPKRVIHNSNAVIAQSF